MSKTENHLPDVSEEDVKQAEDLITNALLNLSFQNRNAINEEIHGVRILAPNETPELLQWSLLRLDVELTQIPDKPGFDKSQILFLNDTYVNTVDFRLKFLRCERFDTKKAAMRMVAFLNLVDELFDGNEVLRRPIQITDLSKGEMKIEKADRFSRSWETLAFFMT